jgi:hypothetical protein
MADINSENKAAVSVPPVTEFDPSNIPTGFSADSPQALSAISDLQKSRGSLRSVAQNVVAGGAAGAQAAQGSTDPLSAFMQGTAAGLQIPAMLYKQKADQLQNTLDASPLRATMPDLADRYPVLASMPTAMAIKTIQDIALDSAHMIQQHNAKVGEGPEGPGVANPQGELTIDQLSDDPADKEVIQAAALLNKVDLGHRTWTPADVAGWNKSDLVKMVDSAKAQNANVFARGATLPPNIVNSAVDMIWHNDVSLLDTMSPYQRLQVTTAYSAAHPGDSITNRIAAAKNIENPQVQQQLRTMQSIVGDPATGVNPDGTPVLADQLLAAHAALNNFKTTGLMGTGIGAAANYIKNKWQGLTQDQRLTDYNSLENMFAQETGRAMTGGVPTNERVEQEKSTLGSDLPQDAIQQSVNNTRKVMHQRMIDMSMMPTTLPAGNQPQNAGGFAAMPPEGTIVPDRYGIQYVVHNGLFQKLAPAGGK